MAIFSVAQTNKEDQIVADTNWEQESYREGCAYPCEQARVRLKALDDELLRRKPKGWTVLGVRERTMVTRFGEVVIRRRIYRDQDGQSRIALDEHISWESHRQASPTLTESSVSIASAVPFRMADEMVNALTAGVLSTSTVYRLLRDVGHRAIDDERSRWDACFQRGEDVCDGQQQTDVLYTEADGVWARLWQTDRNFCLRWHTCRINDGCPAGDVLSTTRTDQDGTQRQRVRRVQREYWNGLAQPGAQRSAGRAEPGNHGIQRGQAHREPNEEAGYELDDTGSAPYGQSDPVESER